MRYKLLLDIIHHGFNGLVSDLDIVFHGNPFTEYFDRLNHFAMASWVEMVPLKVNGGIFFARGDKDPQGQDRIVARWVLSEFVRRLHKAFRFPDEEIAKVIAYRPDLTVETFKASNSFFEDPPYIVQHVTDDQDLMRDCLESASATGYFDLMAYRGLRERLEEERGNTTGVDLIQDQAWETRAVMHERYQWNHGEWPDFKRTAGANFRCYVSRQPPWVELSVPGTRHIERFVKAPDWLLRGQAPCKSGDANLRPAVVQHCVGKEPSCLYPPMWRPGALPEGRPQTADRSQTAYRV